MDAGDGEVTAGSAADDCCGVVAAAVATDGVATVVAQLAALESFRCQYRSNHSAVVTPTAVTANAVAGVKVLSAMLQFCAT